MPGRTIISDFNVLYLECAEALDLHQDAVASRCPRAGVLLASALFLWDEVVAWLDRLPLTEEEKGAYLVELATCRGQAADVAEPAVRADAAAPIRSGADR